MITKPVRSTNEQYVSDYWRMRDFEIIESSKLWREKNTEQKNNDYRIHKIDYWAICARLLKG
jgi:hypothetical protein